MNRTLVKRVDSIFCNTGVNLNFWAQTMSIIGHLVNQPSASVINFKTLGEVYIGNTLDYLDLKSFWLLDLCLC